MPEHEMSPLSDRRVVERLQIALEEITRQITCGFCRMRRRISA
jgi:hypothetical protein